jgi:peptidoglycan/xylan/chitin deacetylase (PgdA/CDA1 family)
MTTSPTPANHFWQTGWSFPGVPVFVYHGLADEVHAASPNERKYWVKNVQFSEHLDYISRSGYQVWLLKDLANRNYESDNFPSTVVITFDDGWCSDYRVAFPLLLKGGMKAEFFVNTAKVGTPSFVSWQEIREMHVAGMSIQSHGHDHLDLTRLSQGELEWQLKVSKQILEDRLGSSVDFLAAPHGRLNRRVMKEARRVGYRAVCSARSLPACPHARKLNRVVLLRDTEFWEFQQLLEKKPLRYLSRIARAPLYWPKRAILWFHPVPFSEEVPKER